MITVPAPRPRQLAWVDLLRELAAQVEQGTVYERHLPTIAAALEDVLRAMQRRGSTPRAFAKCWMPPLTCKPAC